MLKKEWFYELCFYGDEDEQSDEYKKHYNEATSFCVKSNIEITSAEAVLALLEFEDKVYEEKLKQHMTAWFEITIGDAVDGFGYSQETGEL